jgi:spore maturation protein CgeB
MRWLIVMPFDRPGHMGVDFADELTALGHEVRTFAYRRDNALYKNAGSKALYQRWLAARLERLGLAWRPALTLVVKGGPFGATFVRRFRTRVGTRVVNVFPDNPLWMIPFECVEAYDVFFTKERYALRALQQAGLRNLHYLPMYCVPATHHPVALTDAERARFGAPLSLVGSRYPYRERFVRELAGYPLRVWGGGWDRARDPAVRALVAGGPVWGHAKLCVYSGSTLSLNQHHPMNDIVGVNTRAFELAAAGACQVVDFKEDLATLFKPGEELVAYRDLRDLRRQLDHHLAHPEEAAALGANARRRALAEHTLRHRIDEIIAAVEERCGALG